MFSNRELTLVWDCNPCSDMKALGSVQNHWGLLLFYGCHKFLQNIIFFILCFNLQQQKKVSYLKTLMTLTHALVVCHSPVQLQQKLQTRFSTMTQTSISSQKQKIHSFLNRTVSTLERTSARGLIVYLLRLISVHKSSMQLVQSQTLINPNFLFMQF